MNLPRYMLYVQNVGIHLPIVSESRVLGIQTFAFSVTVLF